MASDRHLARLLDGAAAWNRWRREEPLVRPDLQGLSLTLAQKQWGQTSGGPIDLAQSLLREADLRHATLVDADLSSATLVGADLSGARMRNANLRHANAAHARFDGTDLEGAQFAGANLAGADLSGARNLGLSQIETAHGDAKTLLPQRLVAPAAWRNCAVAEPRMPVSAETPKATAEAYFPSVLRSRTPDGDAYVNRFGRALSGPPRPRLDTVADQARRTVQSMPRPKPGHIANRAKLALSGLPHPRAIVIAGVAGLLLVFGFGGLLALSGLEHGDADAARRAVPAPAVTAVPEGMDGTDQLSKPADQAADDHVRLAFASRADDEASVPEKSVGAPIVGSGAQAYIESYLGQPVAARSRNDTMERTDLPTPGSLAKPTALAKAPAPEATPETPQALDATTSVVDYLSMPDKSSDWIKVFIKSFYLSGEALDEADLRRIYSHEVDYFGARKTTLDKVAREKARYYRDWPRRHYDLVPGSISIEWKSTQVADVSFTYDYTVFDPKKKKSSKGRGRAHLTFDLRGRTGRIVREDGEVIAQY